MNSSSGVSPARNFPGLRVEVVELALEDRNDVPGDVLVDLWIGQRSAVRCGHAEILLKGRRLSV